jgi:hypothetical protein
MTPAEKKQLNIARDTLKMPNVMIAIMGSMTKEQAIEIVNRHAAEVRESKNKARRDRHQAMLDLGLVRVRGALGGVYYE